MWTYLGVLIEEIEPEYVGFVYRITNLVTNRTYIGKKLSKFSRSKKLKGMKKKKRFKVESDWKTYYGSNQELIDDVEKHGPDKFKRDIIRLCKSKAECSYYEAREQFLLDVLLNEEYYNAWISVRLRKSHLMGKV